jgi:hypothetical protein
VSKQTREREREREKERKRKGEWATGRDKREGRGGVRYIHKHMLDRHRKI